MTPNQNINTVRSGPTSALALAKAASTICLLAGIWLFVSPWVYGAYTRGNAWNCWFVGGLIILFSITRILRPAYSMALSWCNIVLGLWTFFSPWTFGYVATNTGRFINSLCVGVIVVVFSIISLRAAWNRNAPPAERSYRDDADASARSR